jgi:predicted glycoside hydrolase/deacetylase ChbG (UPF0249 family)
VTPIVVCADDFAQSQPTSQVILDLLERRAINATSCLVEGEAWPAGAPMLRRLADAGPDVVVGLHLNLTERLARAVDASLPEPDPISLARLLLPATARLESQIYERFFEQWTRFDRFFGRPPDFIDGHQHVHMTPAARGPLLRLIKTTGFNGWIRQCRTSSARPGLKRVLLDRLSDQLLRKGAAAGVRFNAGFGGLRQFHASENLERIWTTDLAAMTEGGVLMVHPGGDVGNGAIDPIGRFRLREASHLASGWMQQTLDELGLVLGRCPAS